MSEGKKKRACPVLGRDITSAECGTSRCTRLACPATCPHHPFSPEHYAQVLEIEDGLIPKVQQRLAAELGQALPASATGAAEDMEHFARMVRALFFDRDVAGRTFAERWRTAGFAGLSNDERVIFEGQTQMHVVLLEVHRVGLEQCEAQDRLELAAPPLIILDRSLAHMAVRFIPLLAWAFPQPHYWRLQGVACVIPDCQGLEPEEIVRAVVQHLGGPVDMPALRDWLQANFALMHRALGALGEDLQQRLIAQTAVSFHTAAYRLRIPAADMERRLGALPALVAMPLGAEERKEGSTHAWAWLDETGAAAHAARIGVSGPRTLGNVVLGPGHLCLKGGMGERFAALRTQFERWFGNDVELAGERTDDVARQLALRYPPKFDPTLVPPTLLEHAQSFDISVSLVKADDESVTNPVALQRRALRANSTGYADVALPVLDGHTPREAARDLVLRPQLLTLMKHHVCRHDLDCRRAGLQEDINGLLRDLGLTELDFPPPPFRPELAEAQEPEPDEFEQALVEDPRPLAPPLPTEPLTEEEVGARFDLLMQVFPEPADLLDACDADSAGLLTYLEENCIEWHEHDRFSLLGAVANAWFLIFPPEYRPRPLDFDRLDAAIERALDELDALHQAARQQALDEFLDAVDQPAIFNCASLVIVAADSKKKKLGVERLQAKMESLAILRALVNELDAAAR